VGVKDCLYFIKRLFEKYQMKPIISKNLTPLPPSLVGKGVFKASPRRGERFGEGFIYTFKTFQTSSKNCHQIFNFSYKILTVLTVLAFCLKVWEKERRACYPLHNYLLKL